MPPGYLKTGTEEGYISEHREEVPFIIRNQTRKTILMALYSRYKRFGQAHGITAEELGRMLRCPRTTLLTQMRFLEGCGLLVSKRLANQRLWMLNIYAGNWLQEVLRALSKHYGTQL